MNHLTPLRHELNGAAPFGLRCRRLLAHLAVRVSILKTHGGPLKHSHCDVIYGTVEEASERTAQDHATVTAEKYKITVH